MDPRSDVPPRLHGGWRCFLRTLTAFGLSALFLYAFATTLDPRRVAAALAGVDPLPLLIAFAGAAGSLALRIVRWRAILRPVAPGLPLRTCASVFLASIAGNNVLPFRFGDFWRIWAGRTLLGVEGAGLLASMMVEKLLDLLVLLAGAGALAALAPDGLLPAVVRGSLDRGLFAVCGAAVLLAVFHGAAARAVDAVIGRLPHRFAPAARRAATLLTSLGRMAPPSRQPLLLGLSLAGWCAEGLVMMGSLAAVGGAINPGAAYAAILLATLATMLPGSPGYIGTFHYFALLGTTLYGIDADAAASAVILAHVVIWLPPTLAGLLAWVVLRQGTTLPARSLGQS